MIRKSDDPNLRSEPSREDHFHKALIHLIPIVFYRSRCRETSIDFIVEILDQKPGPSDLLSPLDFFVVLEESFFSESLRESKKESRTSESKVQSAEF